MKSIYKLLLLSVVFISTSCSLDDTADTDLNDDGPNLVVFSEKSTDANIKATGDVIPFSMVVEAIGPTFDEIDRSITGRVVVNQTKTTAIEGVHYSLDPSSSEFQLDPSNNLIGSVSVNIITAGIVPPLDVSPVLVLDLVSDDSSVIASGNSIEITIKYLCASDLAGSYSVSGTYIAYDGTSYLLNFADTVTQTGDGVYRTGEVGHWTAAQLGYTPGFTFSDLCGDITISAQYLVDAYANIVEGVAGKSKVNSDGSLYFEYTISYGGNSRYYYYTYTPN